METSFKNLDPSCMIIKQKIIFVFGSSVTSSTFATHRVLEELSELGSFLPIIVIRQDLKCDSDTNVSKTYFPDDVYTYKANILSDKNYLIWMWSTMIINIKRSKAFKMRAYRRIFGKYRRGNFNNDLTYLIYLCRTLYRADNIWIFLSFVPLLNRWINNVLKKKINESQRLTEIIQTHEPIAVVLVTNGAEAVIEEVRISATVSKVPWFMIVDNWDNISSKSVFAHQPDLLLVWGEQQKNLAMKIHKFADESISIIGSRRLAEYWVNAESKNTTRKCDLKILYVGQQEPYDEINDIANLFTHGNLIKTVAYRPHPLRKYSVTEINELQNLVIQRKLILSLSPSNKNFVDCFNSNEVVLESPSESIQSVDCVVGAPTTMILESLLARKITFVVSRDDRLYRTTSKYFWDNYEHFYELKKISYLLEINDILDFEKSYKNLAKDFSGASQSDLDILNYLVSEKSKNYTNNLDCTFKNYFYSN